MKKEKMVVGFMFNVNKTEILLIEKNRPRWQFGKFNGIGGKCKPDEPYHVAMVREFKEETGIDCDRWRQVMVMGGEDWEVAVFTCITDDVFNFKTMTDEKVCLISLDELDKFILIDNLYWIIPMCLDQNINYKFSN